MSISRHWRWAIQLFLLAVLSACAGYYLRFDPLVCVLPTALGFAIGVALVTHLLIGWIPRWRPYFARVGFPLAVLVLAIVCFTTTDLHFWDRDQNIAKRYVANIEPALDNYHSVNGRYPDALSKLPSAPAMPYRLTYKGDADEYVFEYDTCCIYSSATSAWFDDD